MGWVLALAARLRARWGDREEGRAARGVEDQGPTVDRMAARRVVATRLGRRRLEGRLASEWWGKKGEENGKEKRNMIERGGLINNSWCMCL